MHPFPPATNRHFLLRRRISRRLPISSEGDSGLSATSLIYKALLEQNRVPRTLNILFECVDRSHLTRIPRWVRFRG